MLSGGTTMQSSVSGMFSSAAGTGPASASLDNPINPVITAGLGLGRDGRLDPASGM